MKKLFKDLLYGGANEYLDAGRLGALLGLFTFLALVGAKVWRHEVVTLTDFGTGFVAVAGGAATLIGASRYLEQRKATNAQGEGQ
jgi:hypothetical protein